MDITHTYITLLKKLELIKLSFLSGHDLLPFKNPIYNHFVYFAIYYHRLNANTCTLFVIIIAPLRYKTYKFKFHN